MSAAFLGACAPTVIPEGESRQAPALAADHYVAADGTRLPLARWPADGGAGSPKVIVLGLHGFGDYRNAFEEPAALWSRAGIETIAFEIGRAHV